MTNSPKDRDARRALALANIRISNLEKRIEAVDRESDRQIEALKERLNALEPDVPSQETVRRELDAWGDREEAMRAKASSAKPAAHYACQPDGYQPIDVAEKWIASAPGLLPTIYPLWWNVVKYAGRWPHNSPTSDLKKLIDYAQRLLKVLESARTSATPPTAR